MKPVKDSESATNIISGGGLPRKLGLISATAVLVGITIGSGIFRSPAGIATRVPTDSLYLLIWVLGGLVCLCGALTYAELSGALPHTGGVYVYLREGFGRLPAFLFGWTELLIIRGAALGAIATVFAEYLLRLLHIESAEAVRYLAATAVAVVATINLVGVNLSAAVQNLATGIKYGALILLVLAAFIIGGQFPTAVTPPASSVADTSPVASFGLALISVLWVYDGWADVTFVSGEVKRPERNLPLALIIGTFAIIAIYLLTNLAYLHLLDIHQIAHSKLVAADSAYRMVGDIGLRLVSLAVMLSAFGSLNGSTMASPRIFFAMAEDGLFFRKIASVHPRFKTPYVAILLAAGLAIMFVMIRTFEQLADTFVLGIWPFYAGGIAAVFALRRKRPNLSRPYQTWGYPITPAVFILAALFLIGNALAQDLKYIRALLAREPTVPEPSGAMLVFAIILAGIPAYLLWGVLSKKPGEKK